MDNLKGAVARGAGGEYIITRDGIKIAEMRRIAAHEECSITVNGNDIANHWGIFDGETLIDHDRYRADLADLYGFRIWG